MNKHNFKAINFHVKRNPLKPVDNGVEIAFPQGNVIDCVITWQCPSVWLYLDSAEGIDGKKLHSCGLMNAILSKATHLV